ncbi:MAG: hypothetical protein OXL39_17175, partial [Caldilineaceae bacterium]|nr:hypothetical protein [Caldilineaceae bacterium]
MMEESKRILATKRGGDPSLKDGFEIGNVPDCEQGSCREWIQKGFTLETGPRLFCPGEGRNRIRRNDQCPHPLGRPTTPSETKRATRYDTAYQLEKQDENESEYVMNPKSDLQPIPVTIITGFLGSGKTTLLNRVLHAEHGLRVAVLVNDFGAINIDTQLVVGMEEDTISLANGCIC